MLDQSIKGAVAEYIENISSAKSISSQKQEFIYFKEFEKYFLEKKVIRLKDINTKHMEFFQTYLYSKKNKKVSTVNRQFCVYVHFFNRCVAWSYLEKSPCLGLKKLKELEPIRELFTQNEIIKIISHSEKWFSLAFEFLAITGCRPDELKILTFDFVDFENELIIFPCKKTRGGHRLLPISARALEIIKERQRIDSKDFIFKNDSGGVVKTNWLNKKLIKIQKDLGIKRKTIYSLRHTYLTGLCDRNVNLEKIRLIAGHRKIITTQKYFRVSILELKKVVNGG